VFPDLQQILDNNTNAETGACPDGPVAQPVAQASTECFAEFLPTADYVGYTGVNDNPPSLHFRLTARDGKGGTSSADTTLVLAKNAGPFLVTSPNTAVTYAAGSTQTISWTVAGTDIAPVNTANVKISLSVDGGHTYPYVLAESTPNNGSAQVTLPNSGTTQARVKIEAVGNIFFDVSNADFTIQDATPPVIAAHDPVVAEATSATGATVSYTSPATSDAVDGTGTAICSPISDSQFALGDTTVTCNATDKAGNQATATTFKVTVQDTTPPDVTVPTDIINGAPRRPGHPSGASALS
jgi:hypothetical protein